MTSHPRPLIMHVVHRFTTGGLENGVVNLINCLPASRWRHAVVALTSVSQAFCARVKHPDVLYVELNKKPGHGIWLSPALWKLFRLHRPAIVHTRNLSTLEASLPALLAGVPVRIHGEHGWDTWDLDGSRQRYRFIRRLYSPFIGRYIALSDHLHDYLSRKVGIDQSRIVQIYNGVDTERFFPASAGRLPIPGCPFQGAGLWLIGTVGRLQPVKNQTHLVRAFVRSLQCSAWARERLRLVIVGDGPLRGEIEKLLREERAQDLVWLAGERSDIPQIMRGLDCFALPSLAEGISNTVLEAMASGLPVVATRVGGNAELIQDGLTGRLIPAQDIDVLVSAMLEYASDAVLARGHGKAGRKRVERCFSLDRMVAAYDSLYRDTLAQRGVVLATPGTV